MNSFKLFIPIHFTRKEDMDGIGCAILSNLVFGRGISKIGYHFTSPIIYGMGSGKEAFEKKLNSLYNEDGTFTDKFKNEIDFYFNGAIGNGKGIPVELIFIVILTDCYHPDIEKSFIPKLKETYKDSKVLFWHFDHHETNPYFDNYIEKISRSSFIGIPFEAILVSNYDIGCKYSSSWLQKREENVDYFESCMYEHEITNYRVDYDYSQDAEMSILSKTGLTLDTIEEEFGEGNTKNVNPERSATFLYFKFLFLHGFIGISSMFSTEENKHEEFMENINVFTNLCVVVSHISNYDTYEFDKMLPSMTNVMKRYVPDLLTVLWKYQQGDFYGMINKMVKNIKDASLNGVKYEIDSEKCICGNIPLEKSDIDLLHILYEQRNRKYKKSMRYVKVITYEEFKSISPEKLQEEKGYNPNSSLKDSNLFAVFLEDVEDASYVGNRVLKENPDIKMAIIGYVGSRILSVRSNNKDLFAPHCELIMEKLGGGGHRNSAGCKLTEEEYCALLNLCWKKAPGLPIPKED